MRWDRDERERDEIQRGGKKEEGEGATGLICSGSDPERAGRQRRVGSRGGLGLVGRDREDFLGSGV